MALGDEGGEKGGVQGGVPPGLVSPAWLWSEATGESGGWESSDYPAVLGLLPRQLPGTAMPAEGQAGLQPTAVWSRAGDVIGEGESRGGKTEDDVWNTTQA